MEIVDNIDKNSKCDREKVRKIQSLQSKIHKALKSGSMSLYNPTTKQELKKIKFLELRGGIKR